MLANGSARDSTKLALSGGTMSGVLNTQSPTSYVKSTIQEIKGAPITVPIVNVGSSSGYVPFLHQRASFVSGYVTHLSLGIYKHTSA